MLKIPIYFIFTILLIEISFASQNDFVRDMFKKSTRYQLWLLKNQEIDAGKKAQLGILPLRLDTTVYRNMPFYSDKDETAAMNGAVQEYSDVFSVDLIYRDFSSFTNTFGLEYARNQYDESYGSFSNARRYDLSNKFEYNLTNNSSNSDLRITQDLELAALSLSELQAIKTLNDEYVDFLQKSLTYALTDCKLKNQVLMKDLVDETTKKGQTLLSINAIARKEYLNYENLQIELEKNIAILNNDFLQAKYDAESAGIIVEKDLNKGALQAICQPTYVVNTTLANDDLKKNIDFEILQKQIEIDSLQIKNAKRDTVSDIKPFVELGLTSTLNQESKDYRVIVGVSVGWDIPNSRQYSAVRYRTIAKAYSTGDYQLTKRKMDLEAKSINQDLKYLSQIMEITKRNMKSNDDLLKILKLENSLRKGDSLNFINAVTNRVNLINDYFDLVLQAETKTAQFDLLRDGKYVVK